MTKTQYLKALSALNLTPYSAAPYLGISIRQSHRYASGEQPVAEPIALLLAMYLKHGLSQ
jgi:peptidase E